MSLDISLIERNVVVQCPCCGRDTSISKEVFQTNITHNVGKMASEARVYNCIWAPKAVGIKKAEDLLPFIEKGLGLMMADPQKFKELEAKNGWGTYKQFFSWLEILRDTCLEHPEAEIEVCL